MSTAVATREDWKALPMPARTAVLEINLSLTQEELQRVTSGHIPFDMDDKWFIFFEEPTLYFHRSWTGTCVYRAAIKQNGDGSAVIASAEVNRDPEQHATSDDRYDRLLLIYLVEQILLQRDVPFPVPQDATTAPPGVFQHHMVGSGNREVVIEPQDPKPWWKFW